MMTKEITKVDIYQYIWRSLKWSTRMIERCTNGVSTDEGVCCRDGVSAVGKAVGAGGNTGGVDKRGRFLMDFLRLVRRWTPSSIWSSSSSDDDVSCCQINQTKNKVGCWTFMMVWRGLFAAGRRWSGTDFDGLLLVGLVLSFDLDFDLVRGTWSSNASESSDWLGSSTETTIWLNTHNWFNEKNLR